MNAYTCIKQPRQWYKKIRDNDNHDHLHPLRILREISSNESFLLRVFCFELFLSLASIKDALVASE